MKVPFFSIVIPVYNVENFLVEAIESVLTQDFNDFEVILVNDGSTDGSTAICREYLADIRVKLIEQNNMGQSMARNNGIEAARGEYIYFFDSDDILEQHSLSSWYKEFKRTSVDAILFSASLFGEEYLTDFKAERYHRTVKGKLKSYKFIESSLNDGSFSPSACCYVLKRSLLDNIKFKKGLTHEDELFYAQLFLLNDLDVYIDQTAYFKRRIRAGSIMTSRKGMKNFNGYQITFDELKHAQLANVEQQRALNSFLFEKVEAIVRLAVEIDGVPISYYKRKKILQNLFWVIKRRLLNVRTLILTMLPESLVIKRLL